MLLIMGTVRIDPEMLVQAEPLMRRMVEASRAEDGCEAYAYAQDLLEPGLIHVSELWRDQAALDLHFQTPHLAEWRAAWPSFGIRDRNLRLYQLGESKPL